MIVKSEAAGEMMTVWELTEVLRAMLLPVHGKEESTALIYRLLEHFLKLNRAAIVMQKNMAVGNRRAGKLLKSAQKLADNEPLQYVIGEALFCDLTFRVNRHVLIPRPETEEMVLWVSGLLKDKLPQTILDIGTGSGCIAIVLKKRFPGSRVIAMDISKNALRVAAINAVKNEADVELIHGDILKDNDLHRHASFDLIISNPPYVRISEKLQMMPNVLDYEPHKALFVPDEDPLKFYRAICKFALQYLSPDGMLVFEVNENFGKETADLLLSQGFAAPEVKKDFRGKDRFVIARKGNDNINC
jgi:release factor glutamine methyltransferase